MECDQHDWRTEIMNFFFWLLCWTKHVFVFRRMGEKREGGNEKREGEAKGTAKKEVEGGNSSGVSDMQRSHK